MRLVSWPVLLMLAGCGGPSVADEAPPGVPPTGIPVAAANASGARFPQPPLVSTSTARRPPVPPKVPVDPFGFPPEMVDGGPPAPPPPPPKKKGTPL